MRGQKDRGVGEHLAQARVAEAAGDETVERGGEELGQIRVARAHLGGEKRLRGRKGGVEEVPQREVIGPLRRIQVLGELFPRPWLDRLEKLDGLRRVFRHIDRVLAFREQAVGRVERHQV